MGGGLSATSLYVYMSKKLHRSNFIKELKLFFPELTKQINSDYGLIHLEMISFRDFIQSKIDCGDRKIIIKAFQLAEKYLLNGNLTLSNAIIISFLEDLNFKDEKTTKRKWALELLPTSLKNILFQRNFQNV